jgi:hypothetical protein
MNDGILSHPVRGYKVIELRGFYYVYVNVNGVFLKFQYVVGTKNKFEKLNDAEYYIKEDVKMRDEFLKDIKEWDYDEHGNAV